MKLLFIILLSIFLLYPPLVYSQNKGGLIPSGESYSLLYGDINGQTNSITNINLYAIQGSFNSNLTVNGTLNANQAYILSLDNYSLYSEIGYVNNILSQTGIIGRLEVTNFLSIKANINGNNNTFSNINLPAYYLNSNPSNYITTNYVGNLETNFLRFNYTNPISYHTLINWVPTNNPPPTPEKGTTYYSTVDDKMKVWNGTTWRNMSQ